MKTILIFFQILILTLQLSADFSGKVVGVSDGDTITVLRDGRGVKIRLYGVDCPESSQDFGQAAKKFTSGMVYGKTVKVEEKDSDRYGRTVGIVYVDAENLNLSLLRNGFAWYYKAYAKNEKTFASAQAKAKAAKTGLWSMPGPIAPWDYRRALRDEDIGPASNSGKYSVTPGWAAIIVAILALLSGAGAKKLLRPSKKKSRKSTR